MDCGNARNQRSEGLASALRARGIGDERVLGAIARVPRDLFVGEMDADAAWDDRALPIGCGQTISQPYIVAYMTEQLQVGPEDEVLEIGTGSGYQAAVLAHLCRHVYTIERHEPLLEAARKRFDALGLDNITAITGDGAKGWPEARCFERIIVTAAARKLPTALTGQLAEGGRMILPLGGWLFDQYLVLIERGREGLTRKKLLPVRFVPLISRVSS